MFGFGRKKCRRPSRITDDAPPGLAPASADPDARGPAPPEYRGDGKIDRLAAGNSGSDGPDRHEASRDKLVLLAERIAPHLRQQLELDNEKLSTEVNRLAHGGQTAIEGRIVALAEKIEAQLADRLGELGLAVQEVLARCADPLIEKAATDLRDEAAQRWTALEQRLTDTCSTTAQRAIQRPIIDALLVLHDRIRQEATFQSLRYQKDAELTLHVGCRQLQEWTDSALHSYAAEVLQVLHSLGVELIIGSGGPFNPHHQRVAGVEMTQQSELDGHVVRVLRAGFTWHGTILRSEEVVVFKMERKNHDKEN